MAAMEKCLFGRFELKLPELLLENEDIFMEVVNPTNWQNSVSDSDKIHLLNLLPQFEQNEVYEKQLVLKKLFCGDNFKFGNPLQNFHKKLREGHFSPDVAKYSNMIKKVKQKDYQKRMKIYYSELLKEILVNRQRVVDIVRQLPPGEPVRIQWWTNPLEKKLCQKQCLELRACRKYRNVIKEINEDFGEADTSSDEEDLYSELCRNPSYSSYLLDAEDITPSVMGTFDGKPVISNGSAQPRKRAVSPVRMTEADMKAMMKRHKRKREEDPEDPELDTSGLSIDDVIVRAYGKNFPKTVIKDKVQKKRVDKKCKKQKLCGGSMPALWSHDMELMNQEESLVDSGAEEESMAAQQYMSSSREYGEHTSFLSLLRDILTEEPEFKLSTAKLELKVSDWQKSQCARQNPWFPDCNNWASAASSALRFLAGDAVGVQLENFVPFVDYKERPQLWKWIGQGRDAEDELSILYSHWLTFKEDQELENKDATATPPPRAYTDYIIKTPLDEDKEVFQEQETMRFENPHQSFTYYMHGYESVVGPVKGIYLKPDANVKARDHILLRKDRPSFVTILTLVRDAAARLPNGEGTRADICELLKYSQYLAAAVTDSQINQVVSGALDRLHYEKDPCVKYDTSRKMWIYLHRNRNEDEFDKIHQAHGAIAKAKKALTKGKTKAVLGKNAIYQLDRPSTKNKESSNPVPSQTTLHMVEQPGGGFATVSVAAGSLNHPGTVTSSGGISLLSMPLQSPSSEGLSLQESHAELMQSPKLTMGSPRATPSQSPRHPSPSGSPRVTAGYPRGGGATATSGSSSSMSGLDILSSVAHEKLVGIKPVSSGANQSQQALSGQLIAQVGLTSAQQLQKRIIVSKNQQGVPTPGGISLLGSPEQKASKIFVAHTSPSQIPAGAKVIQTGTKPVAFSLLQSQNISKLLEAKGQGQMKQLSTGMSNQTKTVVFASKSGAHGGQQLLATLKQGPEKMVMPSQADTLLTAGLQQTLTSPSSTSTDSKPVLARLISQTGAPQVITLSGGQKVANSTAVRLPQGSAVSTTNQPGSMQTSNKLNKPLILQRASSVESSRSVSSPAQVASPQPQQVAHIVHQGTGSPATIVISKPGTPPSSKTTLTNTMPGVSLAQKFPTGGLQVALAGKPVLIGGKPVQISGKPIQIGGKPVQLSGKPIQIGGKPMQISGKPLQFGGKPVQIGGKPIQISGKPIQIGGKTIQIGGKPISVGGQTIQVGGKPVQLIQNPGMAISTVATATQAGVVVSSCNQSTGPLVQTVSSSLMNQLLQGGATVRTTRPATQVKLQGQAAPTGVTPQSIRVQGGQIIGGTQQIRIQGATPGGGMQQIRVQGQPLVQQVKVQGQAASGGGQQVRLPGSNSVITLPKTVSVSSGAPGTPRVVTLTQGNLAGQQVFLQSSQGGGTAAKLVASPHQQHQILTGSGGKPTILSSSTGKPMQNIQLVRTVVSQAGGKPGTTILLAQQPGQSGTSSASPVQTIVSQTGVVGGRGKGIYLAQQPGQSGLSSASPGQTIVSQTGVAGGRGKGAPVYARIVAPQGVRYTNVTSQGHIVQGQVLQGQRPQGIALVQSPKSTPDAK